MTSHYLSQTWSGLLTHSTVLFNILFWLISTKDPQHWPLWGESTGERWIPLIKGQWCGKLFHGIITSLALIKASISLLFLKHWQHTKSWYQIGMDVLPIHYDDVIMGAIASLITSLTMVYSTVYSDADQRKHQSSASLAFVRGIHRDRWIPRTKGQ